MRSHQNKNVIYHTEKEIAKSYENIRRWLFWTTWKRMWTLVLWYVHRI